MSIRLTRNRLSLGAASRALEGAGLGGVVVFAGRVRPDSRPAGRVVALEYEVDRAMALRRMRALDAAARRKFGARRVVLWHRFGRVEVGETAVIAGAACGHRAKAFDAARYLIEELKATVPIWKSDRVRPARRPRRPPSRRAGRSGG